MRLVLASAIAALTCAPAFAQDVTGEQEYMSACGGCHGESALGDGPIAGLLNIHTPNLRTIAQENDGVFPFLDVFMMVDGRTGVRAHGGPMPVWGDHFKASAGNIGAYGTEVVARGRITALVLYLESIQE